MMGDGNGWLTDADGTRYWGRFGAAGLLLSTPTALVLLQHRALWSHMGGTWSIPGGARDSHESVIECALREAHEEAGIDTAAVTVDRAVVTASAPSGWTYTTVLASVPEALGVVANRESVEMGWIPAAEVSARPLHPSFAAAWPALQTFLRER